MGDARRLAFTFSVDATSAVNLNGPGELGRDELTRLLLMPLQQRGRRSGIAPANQLAIDRLERVQVDPADRPTCSVCLDEIDGEAMCAPS